ncbi:hypothetical protein [Paraburkholderia sp. Cpub6]|uniref:hypothetical protein n=1 Tax=Paraburkholderia sp. Cpub6 TaxID=2723094 RepID=UPI00161E49A3|nr:hypothetical protein [Paraburkholderia sp. Cpub6]MBB5456778.1 hypothetical protein [Paraburkholderia sp. Cpub6]
MKCTTRTFLILAEMSATLICAETWAEVVTIQAKSFIQTVDLKDPTQFDPGVTKCQQLMAAVVNCGVVGGEDPSDGSGATGNFRLRSEAQIDVSCSGNTISKWQILPIATATGKEFLFLATSGELSPAPKASPGMQGAATNKLTLEYQMRGQPNAAGNLAMSSVKARSCTFIWQKINATVSCKAGKAETAVTLDGSKFPSHRVWVNGVLSGEMNQGPFNNLWNCDPLDASKIR